MSADYLDLLIHKFRSENDQKIKIHQTSHGETEIGNRRRKSIEITGVMLQNPDVKTMLIDFFAGEGYKLTEVSARIEMSHNLGETHFDLTFWVQSIINVEKINNMLHWVPQIEIRDVEVLETDTTLYQFRCVLGECKGKTWERRIEFGASTDQEAVQEIQKIYRETCELLKDFSIYQTFDMEKQDAN